LFVEEGRYDEQERIMAAVVPLQFQRMKTAFSGRD
jgi:hypothetical protein